MRRSLLAVPDENLVALGMDVDDEEGSTNVLSLGLHGAEKKQNLRRLGPSPTRGLSSFQGSMKRAPEVLLYDCKQRKRLLFAHIPKNAGSTIENLAFKAPPRAATVHQQRSEMPPLCNIL